MHDKSYCLWRFHRLILE